MTKKDRKNAEQVIDGAAVQNDGSGTETAPPAPTEPNKKAPPLLPQERWKKLAPKRVARAIKALSAVGNMGARASYQCSDSAREYVINKMLEAVQDAVKRLRGSKPAEQIVQIPE